MKQSELLQAYESELVRVGKSEHTRKTYINHLNIFLNWMEETNGKPFDVPLLEYDTREYTTYLTMIQKASLSTINTKLAAIQSFADFLHAEYDNPVIKVQRKKGKVEPKVDILEKNDINRFRRSVYQKGNKLHIAIIETFLFTGIRESELCALELDDLQYSERKATLIVRDGKGGKYRELTVPNDCRTALMDYLESRPKTDSNKLFIGNRGTLTPNGVYKMVHRLGQSVDVDVYPHMLRHQCFTNQAKSVHNAQDLKDLATNAGHDSIELTMKYYISGSKENRERLSNSINYTI